MPDAEFESRLLWILGSPRSGSTWLLRLLAEHEAVVAIDEPLIGDHLGIFLCDRPGVAAADFKRENFSTYRLLRGASDYFFADEFKPVWQPLLGDLIRRRFLAHVMARRASGPVSKTLVAIKEPNGSQAADLIMGALPHARLLFLLRDGRDVVDSELAAIEKGSWMSDAFAPFRGIEPAQRLDIAVECAYKWLWRTEVVQAAFHAHPGPKLLLRYEGLLRDTQGELRRLFDWLRLELTDAALATVVERRSFERIPAELRGSRRFFRAARPGSWRENLSEDEQRAVEEVIGPKLRELGYES